MFEDIVTNPTNAPAKIRMIDPDPNFNMGQIVDRVIASPKILKDIEEEFPGVVSVDYMIAGGAVLCEWLADNENVTVPEVKDIDIYLLHHDESYYLRVRRFIYECSKNEKVAPSDTPPTIRDLELNSVFNHPRVEYPINIIADKRYTSAQIVLSTFDLVNSMVWYDTIVAGPRIVMFEYVWQTWARGCIAIKINKVCTPDRIVKYTEKYLPAFKEYFSNE